MDNDPKNEYNTYNGKGASTLIPRFQTKNRKTQGRSFAWTNVTSTLVLYV